MENLNRETLWGLVLAPRICCRNFSVDVLQESLRVCISFGNFSMNLLQRLLLKRFCPETPLAICSWYPPDIFSRNFTEDFFQELAPKISSGISPGNFKGISNSNSFGNFVQEFLCIIKILFSGIYSRNTGFKFFRRFSPEIFTGIFREVIRRFSLRIAPRVSSRNASGDIV